MPEARRDIIVIGTSHGGVEALQVLVAGLPPQLEAAVFVVIHLSPGHRTYIADILRHIGRMPVRLARNMEPVQTGQILIAPPDNHMLLGEGYVRILHGPKENGHRPAVDPLFRSAAYVYGPRVIGCVLTGSLGCGTNGLAVVKRRGGLAVVQDPNDAVAPDMPRSALEVVQADHVVRLDELAPLLARLCEERVQLPERAGALDPVAGTPSGLSCPACGGVLADEVEAGVAGYRCRVGHAYSTDGLGDAQRERVEQALWSAVLALAESAFLQRRMASRALARGDERLASDLEAHAISSEKRSNVIRGLLSEGAIAGPDAGNVA